MAGARRPRRRTRRRSASSGRNCTAASTTFVGHLQKVGRSLDNALGAYNSAVGSFERNVTPQARRFTELGATSDLLPSIEPAEQVVRLPQLAAEQPAEHRRTARRTTPIRPRPSRPARTHEHRPRRRFRSAHSPTKGRRARRAAPSWSPARAPASAAPSRWRWRPPAPKSSCSAGPSASSKRCTRRSGNSAHPRPASCRSTSNARSPRTTKRSPPPSRHDTAGSMACCTTPRC